MPPIPPVFFHAKVVKPERAWKEGRETDIRKYREGEGEGREGGGEGGDECSKSMSSGADPIKRTFYLCHEGNTETRANNIYTTKYDNTRAWEPCFQSCNHGYVLGLFIYL